MRTAGGIVNSTARLTHKRLTELLHYDPKTGEFTWLVKRSPKTPAGSVAGSHRIGNYTYITIDFVSHRAHRLAWLYMTGCWPSQIDHIDGNPSNNIFSNLRIASQSMNRANSRRVKNRKYDLPKGVTFCEARRSPRKFRAQIYLGGKRRLLGYFLTEDEAKFAYGAAARATFGEFARP